MDERPIIKIVPTAADRWVEILGWLALLTMWIFTIKSYSTLPDIIPVHYNVAGQPDGYGQKITILTLPGIALVLFVGLTVLNRFPHIFNYPTEITPENALRQYTHATRLIRYIKLGLVMLFCFILFHILQTANGADQSMNPWVLPVGIGFIFVVVAYFVVKAYREK